VSVTVQAERLVGTAELEHMLGVTRQRIFQLTSSGDFPEPLTALRMGQIWDLAVIRSWARKVGRTLTELPAQWPLASPAAAGTTPRSGKYGRRPE